MVGQKCAVFFLKSDFPMMFALGFDVFADSSDVGFTHGECSIARLPCKVTKCLVLRFEPFGRGFLCVLHHVANRNGPT